MIKQSKDGIMIGQYHIFLNQILGSGSFGTVYKAIKDNRMYACKEMTIENNQMFKQVMCELTVMSVIKHQNLVYMEDYSPIGRKIYIFMEFCNQGNIVSLIPTQNSSQQELIVLKVLNDIMEGLKKLQENNIIHRDIKPHNILLHDGIYKLSDFGLAKIVKDTDHSYMTTYLGTPCYSSPQVLRNLPYTSKTDIWSFGVTLFELTFGHLPFQAANEIQLIREISKGSIRQRLNIQLRLLHSQFLKEILEQMLQENEEQRISFRELYSKVKNNQEKAKIQKLQYSQKQQNLIQIALLLIILIWSIFKILT